MVKKGEVEWFEGLQVLKALMFILVFLSHSGSFFEVNGAWGACAVEVFFVISGFIAASKYEPADKGVIKEGIEYLCNRYKTYYPLYLLMFIASVPVERPFYIKNFLVNLFMIQSYWGDCKIALSYNWISWFLSSMLLCYLLNPMLNRLRVNLKNRNTRLMIIIFIFQCIWSFVWRNKAGDYEIGYYFVYIFPLARVFDYFWGILLFSCYEKCKGKKYNLMKSECLEIFVVLIFFCMNNMTQYIPEVYSATLIWIPVALGLVWIFTLPKGIVIKALVENKFLQRMGNKAFYLYIIHRMILVYANFFGGNTLFSWFSALSVTLIVGYSIGDIIMNLKESFFIIFDRMKKKERDNRSKGING